MFLATEYGVYVSLNQGEEWHEFSRGLPTISVRDLAIQKRENDLVLATFGRSFYVLDDYSGLRDINKENMDKEGFVFQPRKALQYNQVSGGTTSDGMSSYYAKNPKYGANIKYYIKKGKSSIRSQRIAKESFNGINSEVVEALLIAGYDSPRSLFDDEINDIAENYENFTKSAVLCLLISNGSNYNLDIVLTKRSKHLKYHKGQIRLPGGKLEPQDKGDFQKCAYREAYEEIGFEQNKAIYLGKLNKYVTGSCLLYTSDAADE